MPPHRDRNSDTVRYGIDRAMRFPSFSASAANYWYRCRKKPTSTGTPSAKITTKNCVSGGTLHPHLPDSLVPLLGSLGGCTQTQTKRPCYLR